MPEPHRPWHERALVQLVLVRFREVAREPEAVFWIFLFPVLMAAGLGIAFRSRSEDPSKVAILTGSPWTEQTANRLKNDSLIKVSLLDDSAAAKAAYLASFIISRLSLLVIEAGLLIAFGILAFGVPLRGSIGTLALICVISSLAFGGLGLLIASRPRTVEGASGLMNLAMVPMWVFSGVFFSSSRFPDAIQPFVRSLPLTAVNNALRANMLEGATLAQVAPELGIVAVWLVVCFAIALSIFRWQ